MNLNSETYPAYPQWPEDFIWSHWGQLEGYNCLKIEEKADPHPWHDNYFCYTGDKRDPGFQFHTNGRQKAANKECVKISEPWDGEDRGTWHDNFLCLDAHAPYEFSWFWHGRDLADREDLECIRWIEPEDPLGWDDNFLCAPRSDRTPDVCELCMQHYCSGDGSCLLIEGQGQFTCEVDPDHFTSQTVCDNDYGHWCENCVVDIVEPEVSDNHEGSSGLKLRSRYHGNHPTLTEVSGSHHSKHTGLIVLISVATVFAVCILTYLVKRFYWEDQSNDLSADLNPYHDITLRSDDVLDRSV